MREALQPGGMLTRAMFDAFCPASMADLDEHVLTIGELEQGITALIKEGGTKRSAERGHARRFGVIFALVLFF